MKQWLIIKLVVWFGWLSSIAVAQLDISGAITGSVSFPHVGIICIGNLAVFITSVLRRRLDLEMGARDLLATIIPGPYKLDQITATRSTNEKENHTNSEAWNMFSCLKLQFESFKLLKQFEAFQQFFIRPIPTPMDTERLQCPVVPAPTDVEQFECPVIGLTNTGSYENASVVMLTNSEGIKNFFIRQFMKYISNAHNVNSILLKYNSLKDPQVRRHISERNSSCTAASGTGIHEQHSCNCLVLPTVPDITMPRGLQQLPHTRCLLPSLKCLDKQCHGCRPNLLDVQDAGRLNVKFSSAVCDTLDLEFTTPTQKDPICICIPVSDDKWTKLLIRSLKYKDQEEKGAIVAVSDALQSYLDEKKEGRDELVTYSTISLIMIRSVEISINLLLTVLFKVDGFSSSLAARRAVRSYVVDSKGNGLPANVFLTSALVVVKSDSVCQVLKFRGKCSGILLFIVGCVNFICFIAWALVLIAFNGGVGKWYEVPSMPPSKPRVVAIIVAVGISIVMDLSEFSKIFMKCFGKYPDETWNDIWEEIKDIKKYIVLVVIVLEIVFAVVSGILGLNKGIGRWVYGALQILVGVKWAIGSCLLGVYSPEYVPRRAQRSDNDDGRVHLNYTFDQWVDEGSLVYSSSFFLNAVLAGVMGNWAGVWSNWM